MPRQQEQQKAARRLWLGLSVTCLALSGTALAQVQVAQIRVYDEKSGGSTAAPTVGGLDLDGTPDQPVTPAKTTKSDKKVTSAIAPVAATPTAFPGTSFGVRTAPLIGTGKTPQAPVQAPTPAPVVQKTDTPTPQTPVLPEIDTEVFVFTNVSEFSPIVAARINEIHALPALNVTFYMDDQYPEKYIPLMQKGLDKVSQDIDLTVDGKGEIAQAYGVKKGNTIVVRHANGALRTFDLIKGIELFKNHIQALKEKPVT